MLYQVITRLIDRGEVAGLREKVDVLFTIGRLSSEEYQAITERL